MNKSFLSGGCSFTFGHELSDDSHGLEPSKKTWSSLLSQKVNGSHVCVAKAGAGNSSIARRIFEYISTNKNQKNFVMIMWTFTSRYDWAMPRNAVLEKTRWASITPWDVTDQQADVFKNLSGNNVQWEVWKQRRETMKETGVSQFADALYRYAANNYHEVYLSWKSIVWLQNILEKKKIPYFFTLADNTLFYDDLKPLNEIDSLLNGLYNEINFDNWFFFGDRKMGFNQWALLNDYPRGTTHPLDDAHKDAANLMMEKFQTIYNKNKW
jgi:hypothetical protein